MNDEQLTQLFWRIVRGSVSEQKFIATIQAQFSVWQPIETAPKDRAILAYCNHEIDPFYEVEGKRLTLYAAHADGLGHAPTGLHIVVWGGGFDDSTWEEPGASLPDWWFVEGSDFEIAANPTHWMELPQAPL